MAETKLADLEELHALGILQEANRLFFHPLGLAMCWELPSEAAFGAISPAVAEDLAPNSNGQPRVIGFLDARDDPEGWCFTDLAGEEYQRKAASVAALKERFRAQREALFRVGDTVQPLGDRRPEAVPQG